MSTSLARLVAKSMTSSGRSTATGIWRSPRFNCATRRKRERTAQILRAVLDRALRLLHPFMPFVTEEVWQHLYADTPKDQRPAAALIVAPWPTDDAAAQRQRDDQGRGRYRAGPGDRHAHPRRETRCRGRASAPHPGYPGGVAANTPLLQQQAALVEQLGAH